MRRIRTVNIREENVNKGRTSDGCCFLHLSCLLYVFPFALVRSFRIHTNCEYDFSIPLRIVANNRDYFLPFSSLPRSSSNNFFELQSLYTTVLSVWIMLDFVCKFHSELLYGFFSEEIERTLVDFPGNFMNDNKFKALREGKNQKVWKENFWNRIEKFLSFWLWKFCGKKFNKYEVVGKIVKKASKLNWIRKFFVKNEKKSKNFITKFCIILWFLLEIIVYTGDR